MIYLLTNSESKRAMVVTNLTHRMIKSFGIIFGLMLLSACQLTTPEAIDKSKNTVTSYGEYYLWLKTLSINQLQAEINNQKHNVELGEPDAKINLLLLSSLPSSPLYNVYNAKSLLNKFQKNALNKQLSVNDFAFISLLKDQLNAQLFLYQDMAENKQSLDQNSDRISMQMKNHQKSIIQLNKKINVLQQQINQLKSIEKNISAHGQ